MKLTARRYCSAQFVTRFMYKLNIAGVAIAILATICCGTNASAEDVSGRVLSPQRIRSITSAIDGEAIIANAKTTKDWVSYGLDYSEGRYSKLSQINTEGVKDLGLKWTYNLESLRGGVRFMPSMCGLERGFGPTIPKCRGRMAIRVAVPL